MFSGDTYNQRRDGERLKAQLITVFNLMQDGKWRTLQQIETAVGAPQASVSARLRDLRKPKFGEHTVLRRYIGCGLYAYRLEVNLF